MKQAGVLKSVKETESNNIILIGMPGAGKSTVGVVLAKKLGYDFLDSDLLIQKVTGKRLQELITERGFDGFNILENEINQTIQVSKYVIATGGSAVYGAEAMEHFQKIGKIVYLKLSFDAVQKRLGNLSDRGVSMKVNQTLRDLYQERMPLYEKYADITIDCEQTELRDVVEMIYQKIM